MKKPVYNITVNSPVTIHIHQSSPIREGEPLLDLVKMGLDVNRAVSKAVKGATITT